MTTSANADGSFSFSRCAARPRQHLRRHHRLPRSRLRQRSASGDTLKTDAADGTLDLPRDDLRTDRRPRRDPDRRAGDAGQRRRRRACKSRRSSTSPTRPTAPSPPARPPATASAISLVITLPPGAVVAGFPDNQNRYVVDQDNFTVFDTVPVLPGEQHLVQSHLPDPVQRGRDHRAADELRAQWARAPAAQPADDQR